MSSVPHPLPAPSLFSELQAEEKERMLAEIKERAAKAKQEAEAEEQAEKEESKHFLDKISPEEASLLRFTKQPEPIPFVMKNFGARGTVALISGRSGTGKTFLEVLLALGLSVSKPVFGDDLGPQTTGSVVLALMEEPEFILHDRFHTGLNILFPAGYDKHLLSRIYPIPAHGKDMILMKKNGVDFEPTEAFEALVRFVNNIGDCCCIFLDPINLLHAADNLRPFGHGKQARLIIAKKWLSGFERPEPKCERPGVRFIVYLSREELLLG